ncbi:hypothetical protein C7B61_20260 [filamentous cyanobacterium CCP1]|nr:hypothetical protein C7B76_02700 [filamentous cyanobacterium CCP2]PSB56842.1 hypothetical protein C7B61_20260 [filamentous cyanobacterium CCP1]
MRRVTSVSLSTIGLFAVMIAPALAVITPYPPDDSTDIPTEINLNDRFKDSFINGSGSLNSLNDRFRDSFIDGSGSLNSLNDRFRDSFIDGSGSLNS